MAGREQGQGPPKVKVMVMDHFVIPSPPQCWEQS